MENDSFAPFSNLTSKDSVIITKMKRAKKINCKESDTSISVALEKTPSWLQMITNTVFQIITCYRQAEEECAKEENQTIWRKCLCPWLSIIKQIKDLIIQLYEKYIQKAVVKSDINLAKCSSCGYIIGRANLDCMAKRRRWVI